MSDDEDYAQNGSSNTALAYCCVGLLMLIGASTIINIILWALEFFFGMPFLSTIREMIQNG